MPLGFATSNRMLRMFRAWVKNDCRLLTAHCKRFHRRESFGSPRLIFPDLKMF